MSSSYPNAYCVKCGKHTETNSKHTVVLQSGSRAVTGTCSDCQSQVYKIVPKAKAEDEAPQAEIQAAANYPDAFCVKCQSHSQANNARTVLLDNGSRALTGNCGHCGSEVYRILSQRRDPQRSSTLRLVPQAKEGKTTLKLAPNGVAASQAMVQNAEKRATQMTAGMLMNGNGKSVKQNMAATAGMAARQQHVNRRGATQGDSPILSALFGLITIGIIVGGIFAYAMFP